MSRADRLAAQRGDIAQRFGELGLAARRQQLTLSDERIVRPSPRVYCFVILHRMRSREIVLA